MKNKFIGFVTACVVAFFLNLNTFAQVFPETVPLESLGVLKAYALSQVKQLGVQVYGESVTGNRRYSFVDYNSADADPEEMANTIALQELKFDCVPTDTISSYVSYSGYLTSESGSYAFDLFYGYNQFKLERIRGIWSVPASALNVELEMSDYIPFKIPANTSYVEMFVKNEKGEIIDQYNFANDGRFKTVSGMKLIFLGREHLGQNGDLRIHLNDGSMAIYDLKKGNRKSTVTVMASGFYPSVKGVRKVADNTENIIFKEGDSVIRMKATVKEFQSRVTFPSGLNQYPIKVYIVSAKDLAENPNTPKQAFNPYTEQVKFTCQVGEAMFIIFEYNDTPAPLPNGGGDSGGKG